MTPNILQTVVRLGLDHPVVNDRQFRIWRSYAVSAWPTLTVIDPDGYIASQEAGEIPAEVLAPALHEIIAQGDRRGTLNRTPFEFPVEPPPTTPLMFPAKLLIDSDANRLIVSDTSHHRIIVVRLDPDGRSGQTEMVIGNGKAGFDDGTFASASFWRPHGLALAAQHLYVADTWNHAIRRADLAAGHVTTVAGTGEQARRRNMTGSARQVALSSPWDLLVHDNSLFIAMAGTHQIWRFDLSAGVVGPWAGSGAEAVHDDVRPNAALAQPSGLTTDGARLFFADSESSAIRWADFGPTGQVHTIVGTGLFDFGDRDGSGDAVRLQHPLGVAWQDGGLYIADTYNNKIKRLDPATRATTGWLGGAGELWEPGGVAVIGERVYIADTNHHRIVTAGLDADRVEEVEIRGL